MTTRGTALTLALAAIVAMGCGDSESGTPADAAADDTATTDTSGGDVTAEDPGLPPEDEGPPADAGEDAAEPDVTPPPDEGGEDVPALDVPALDVPPEDVPALDVPPEDVPPEDVPPDEGGPEIVSFDIGEPDLVQIDAGPDGTPINCSFVNDLPLEYETLNGFTTAEDFAFDDEGNLVSVDGGVLTKQPMEGAKMPWVPGWGATAGTGYLTDGTLVIANWSDGTLDKVYENGAKETLLGGFNYPNGLDVDYEDYVYIADQSAGTLRRVDGHTGDFEVLANGMCNPNGVSMGVGHDSVFVGSFGCGTVHGLDRLPDGTWSDPYLIADIEAEGGAGGLDPINVDACGFIFVGEYTTGRIWRISPEGKQIDLAIQLPAFWIPNMHWGKGVGGWGEQTLWVIERQTREVFGLKINRYGKDKTVAWP